MIHVIATITLAPGQRGAFLDIFRANVPDVLAEDGCIAYQPVVDAETDVKAQHRVGTDTMMVIEQWASVDALKAHFTAPHMLAYREKTKGMVKNLEVRILENA